LVHVPEQGRYCKPYLLGFLFFNWHRSEQSTRQLRRSTLLAITHTRANNLEEQLTRHPVLEED
jgi:hypothetical protein